eukprot:765923-Hanusia_phi.AAC.6
MVKRRAAPGWVEVTAVRMSVTRQAWSASSSNLPMKPSGRGFMTCEGYSWYTWLPIPARTTWFPAPRALQGLCWVKGPEARQNPGMSNEDQLVKELEEGMDGETTEEVKTDEAGKCSKKGKKSNKGISVKRTTGKVSKPRRPYARFTPEVLAQRQTQLREKIGVANAQITIMSSKLQKYNDEAAFREQDEAAAE